MSEKKYRVLNSTSLGYLLYDFEDSSISVHPNRKKITYQGEKIVIGDFVTLDDKSVISSVVKRTNHLERPRLANCDIAFVLVSVREPDFSSYLLDKFLSFLDYHDIPAGIILSKADLLKKKELTSLQKRMEFYRKEGYSVYFIDAHDSTRFDYELLRNDIRGKSIAFVGQTGVGKSSLINLICPDFRRKVDSLFVTSGRGRHTTKEIVLLPYQDGFIFDTPGFSELELRDMKSLDLAYCFPGYGRYLNRCMFKDCLHLPSSKGCAVYEDVDKKELSMDSYENYLRILEEVKENDRWKRKL